MTPPNPRSTVLALAAIQLVISLGAIPAGLAMVIEPSGQLLGLRTEWIARSPFDSYLVPGLVLLVVNGIGNLVGAAGSLRRRPWASGLGMALGAFLVAWIVVQLYWLEQPSWLQPTMGAFGLAEAGLALRLRAKRRSAAPTKLPRST